ncbi:hypothetical protein M409DRAFT_16638 [Zasmidium cellare ATCC 36951]|uniref:Uncharacterized protein n=1 Tax=Zasmidium cellare ATCC 36951 TaxID=1080233 RepID=A0A6A6D4V3_ZASCE|nr:uncharacterized protein M409DRAFT_16638 [Zasmidium cellare ATCC 36951]KAF2172676.1 hypothetical protein M409DRAFT_16638 [Zasmidium cellare ATCC 36951]
MEYILSVVAALAITPIAMTAFFKLLVSLQKYSVVQERIAQLTRRSSDPIKTSRPVVLVDLSAAVGKRVAAHLMPEYEVILELQSIPRAKQELSSIVAKQRPCTDGDTVGTHDFSRIPKHVIFSKGYRENKVQEVREALGGEKSGISWYWTPSPPGEKLPNPGKIDEEQMDFFAGRIAGHIKKTLNSVVEDGKEGVDGLYEL